MKNIIWFKDLTIKDTEVAGGKNASLGEMYRNLIKKGVRIPNGFAVTAEAYRQFLKENSLDIKIHEILKNTNVAKISELEEKSQEIRKFILDGNFPKALQAEIIKAYEKLSRESKTKETDVAVRSSATAEDMPDASFAGQQETFLNVRGKGDLLLAVKRCFASLFLARSISYREDKKIDHTNVFLSVGVQKMVRSDKACSGILFTIDPDTGFPGVVVINGSWGLGELIVQGEVIPDEFMVFKETLKKGYPSIISKILGSKERTLIYGDGGETTEMVNTSKDKQSNFILTEKEILELANWAVKIEEYYKKPMDIEWAKDGLTNKLYIVQARPETIHSNKNEHQIEDYVMKKTTEEIVRGAAVGTKIAEGKTHTIKEASNIKEFKEGEVLVTRITDPDWEPIMKIASAIVTDEGGRTSHAAIVSRELGIPCVVGTSEGTSKIKNGEFVTIDCSSGDDGIVWKGKCEWEVKLFSLKHLPDPRTKIMVNIGSPNEAFKASFLPVDGVGLAREEFIIASHIKIHPQALINFNKLTDEKVKKEIESLTVGFTDKKEFYVNKLAEGIAKIAAAFYPKPVIVRFSDFKTNEYAQLLGGKYFEPKEENPMIGFRGASRYYHPSFEESFGLECQAIKKVREIWGLENIIVMIPFCRTPNEGRKVLKTMAKFGLKKGKKGILRKKPGLLVYMMAEIPSNIIEADEFLKLFDGFSIGSNDLTQLALGIDRDNANLSEIGDERAVSVKDLVLKVIQKCKQKRKYIGICGQAPSDYEDFAAFLVKNKIDSISLNSDAVLKTLIKTAQIEKVYG